MILVSLRKAVIVDIINKDKRNVIQFPCGKNNAVPIKHIDFNTSDIDDIRNVNMTIDILILDTDTEVKIPTGTTFDDVIFSFISLIHKQVASSMIHKNYLHD